MQKLATALLLCAGYGTRMGRLGQEKPKPLLQVAGRPLIDYLMEQIARLEGISAIHLVSNHRFLERFLEWAGPWRERLAGKGIALAVHDDGSRTSDERPGAVADLALLNREAGRPEGALVAAGDNLFLFPLAPMWRAFRRQGRNLVLAVPETDRAELRRSAVPELGADDRVRLLHRKPAVPPSSWAVPALYCLTRSGLARVEEYLSQGGPRDELGDFIAFLAPRLPVYAFKVQGRRLHIGSSEALRRANEALARDS